MRICETPSSCFAVAHTNDLYIVIVDLDQPSKANVTTDARNVVRWLDRNMNITTKQIIYQDSMGRFDKLEHRDGEFVNFAPLTDRQQTFLHALSISSDAA